MSDCHMGGSKESSVYTHADMFDSSIVFNTKGWAAVKPWVAPERAPHIILHPRLLRSFKALAWALTTSQVERLAMSGCPGRDPGAAAPPGRPGIPGPGPNPAKHGPSSHSMSGLATTIC